MIESVSLLELQTPKMCAIRQIRWSISYKSDSVSFVDIPIEDIPSEIQEHTKLEKLSVCRCPVKRLPEALRKCKNLTDISLNLTALEELPDWLPELERLDYLDISPCSVTQLPETFGAFKKLTELKLQAPRLNEFPAQLTRNSELKSLDLPRCKFDSLPDSICDLKKLQELELASTGLKSLPESMLTMKRLRFLGLSGCPDLGIPDNIIETNSAKKILSYYFTHIRPLPKFIKKAARDALKPNPYKILEDAGLQKSGFTTDEIISRMKRWQRKFKFTIESATYDTLKLRLESLPQEIDLFVRELNRFCPDFYATWAGPSTDATNQDGSITTLEGYPAAYEIVKRELLKEMHEKSFVELSFWWD